MADAEIKTIISANTASFEAGLNQAISALKKAEGRFEQSNKRTELSFQNLGKAAKGLAGAFLVREAVQFGQKLLDLGDKMQTLSERTGAAASFFSALQPEIDNAGGSVDDLSSAINKMNINIAKANSGDKGAQDAFKQIGINARDLAKLKPEEQFYTISTALSQLSTRGQQAAGATAIFGKGVQSLIPTVTKGGEALKAFHDEQVRLGLAMSDDTAARLDELGDSIHTLSLQALNFSAKALVSGLDSIRIGLIGIAENGILAAKALGLLDADVAKAAIEIGEERVQAIKNPKQKDRASPTGGSDLYDTTASDKAISNAQKLSDALYKLQQETHRDVYTSGMDDLQKKLAQVDFAVQDLEKQYNTKITPLETKRVETIKANITSLDEFNKKQKDAADLAQDLSGAFNDAFEAGIMGAESMGDVLGSLAKQIQKIALNQFVTKPLNSLFGSLFQDAAGSIGGGLSKVFPTFSLGSFATGISNVPYDMTARLHAGETVLTRQETESMQKGGSGQSGTPMYNIDARGAGSQELQQLRAMMISLAGPGVIERRVTNAQMRGAL